MSKPITISESVSIKVTTSSSFYYSYQIISLDQCLANAKSVSEINALNFLKILSTTAFIESILCDCLRDVITKSTLNEKDSVIRNMSLYFEGTLQTSTFKSYDKIARDVLGKSLKDFTSDEVWEGIEVLFTLRNQLAHGREFSAQHVISEKENESIEYSTNIRKPIDYLKRKGIIKLKNAGHIEILRDEVGYHFTELAKTFFVDISKRISDEYKTSTFLEFTSLRFALKIK